MADRTQEPETLPHRVQKYRNLPRASGQKDIQRHNGGHLPPETEGYAEGQSPGRNIGGDCGGVGG